MDKVPYQVSGFEFQSKEEYERALKEKETVSYLMMNTLSTDAKAMLKIYNRSIEKESFRTVVGLEYMSNLRKQLIASEIVSAESLAPIPVVMGGGKAGANTDADVSSNSAEVKEEQQSKADANLERQLKQYKEAYEEAKAGKAIKNAAIAILLAVVVGMLIFSFKSQYSIVTYFTNYKEDMREELLDEYEEWQHTLEEKEKELEQREQSLNEQGD
ncbi:MAG: hypothetical protein J1E62_10835 [Lachnospiraceae bacterium]|nr:hypothetical protein [Lachnospiraceae bacterium]